MVPRVWNSPLRPPLPDSGMRALGASPYDCFIRSTVAKPTIGTATKGRVNRSATRGDRLRIGMCPSGGQPALGLFHWLCRLPARWLRPQVRAGSTESDGQRGPHPGAFAAGAASDTASGPVADGWCCARLAMRSPTIGNTSVESTAAPMSAAAVDGRMWPLFVARAVIATTSGS